MSKFRIFIDRSIRTRVQKPQVNLRSTYKEQTSNIHSKCTHTALRPHEKFTYSLSTVASYSACVPCIVHATTISPRKNLSHRNGFSTKSCSRDGSETRKEVKKINLYFSLCFRQRHEILNGRPCAHADPCNLRMNKFMYDGLAAPRHTNMVSSCACRFSIVAIGKYGSDK